MPFVCVADRSRSGPRMVIRNAPGLRAVYKYGAALKRKFPFVCPSEGF